MGKKHNAPFNEGYNAYFTNSKPNPYDSWHEAYEYEDWQKGHEQAAEDAAEDAAENDDY